MSLGLSALPRLPENEGNRTLTEKREECYWSLPALSSGEWRYNNVSGQSKQNIPLQATAYLLVARAWQSPACNDGRRIQHESPSHLTNRGQRIDRETSTSMSTILAWSHYGGVSSAGPVFSKVQGSPYLFHCGVYGSVGSMHGVAAIV